jgi:acid phosphatase type 7
MAPFCSALRRCTQVWAWVILLSPLFFGGKIAAAQPSAPATAGHVDSNPTFTLKQFAPDQPIRLIAYGDMRFTDPATTKGTNPKVRQWLAEKIGAERPQALLVTGDMPYTGELQADWDEYQKETTSWRTDGFPVFPTMGNHEVYHNPAKGIANYLANYPALQGHRYYSALLGPVEVLSLDMNQAVSARSPQGRWFAAQLDHVPPSVEFLMILYHLPWVADTQSQMVAGLPTSDSLILRGALEAHLGKIHAKVLVFHGHIHNYERFERHGVEYIVTGGGGAVPYPILYRGTHDLYRDTGFPVYHYLTLEVHDHQLKAVMWKVIDPDAKSLNVEQKDSFVIQANPPTGLTKKASKKP